MTDKKIILVVDDTPENIDVLTGVLSSDYKIKAAVNGERALKSAASENRPDLILLDIMMPGMDGYEVCRRLKADDQTKDIPVVFVTAKTEDTDETLGFEVGAVDYISKPVSPPIVSARVKNIIALQESQNELKEALDKTLTGSIELMMDVLSLTNPVAFGRARNLRRHVTATAKRLGHQNSWSFEIAAMLSQLGCITLPDELLEKIYNGEAVSAEEKKLFNNHPQVGKRLLEKIPKLEEAAEIIALQNRSAKSLEGESDLDSQVQFGVSLLQVALHMDDLDRKKNAPVISSPQKQVVDQAPQQRVVIEPAVPEASGALEVALSELSAGMILDSDITTRKGMMLMKMGTEVTKAVIERLQGFDDACMISMKTFKVIMPSSDE